QWLYQYSKHLFARVTNPPIDCIREEIITSAFTLVGSERNLLEPEPASAHMIQLKSPILDNEQLEKLRHIVATGFKAATLPILFPAGENGSAATNGTDGAGPTGTGSASPGQGTSPSQSGAT